MNYVAEGKGKRKKIAEKMAAKHLIDKLHIDAL
jgi:dsRNA-specific ribonuclease